MRVLTKKILWLHDIEKYIKLCFDRVNWFHTLYLHVLVISFLILPFFYDIERKLSSMKILIFNSKLKSMHEKTISIFRSVLKKEFFREKKANKYQNNNNEKFMHALKCLYGRLINWWWRSRNKKKGKICNKIIIKIFRSLTHWMRWRVIIYLWINWHWFQYFDSIFITLKDGAVKSRRDKLKDLHEKI